MTIISREDFACAGNEGVLEHDCVQSRNLHAAVIDYLLNAENEQEELQEALRNYLAMFDGEPSNVHISVTPELVACGKGHFLFHSFIQIPGYSELPDDEEAYTLGRRELCGHRLFIFSSKSGNIAKSFQLETYRESTSLFASRPFKRRVNSDTAERCCCTNILVSGPTMALVFLSIEIRRDGTIDMIRKSMIDNELAPWSLMTAALTPSHAVFSTDPIQGPLLHVQKMLPSHDDSDDTITGAAVSIEIGGRDCRVCNVVIIREQYVCAVIGNRTNNEDDEDEFDGEWFGLNNEFACVIYHIPTCQELYRCPLPSEALSVDCIGDTVAMNVSNLGFVITGGNARDVARMALHDDNAQIMSSPSGKNKKREKKKRLASGASGRKKDGFARGQSLRG